MEFVSFLQRYHAGEICLALAAVLIVIDYFFTTDWPAHGGYVCVAAATFFFLWSSVPGGNWTILPTFGVALSVWIALAILHRLVFRRFLENAPESASGTPDNDVGGAPPD